MSSVRFAFHDERFPMCVADSARLDKLYDGCRWAEGPAYFPAHRYLVWSDIPNDRMLRWDEVAGTVGEFRATPAGFSNGNTLDREGRLLSCEHGNRRVSRTEADGSITVIADRYDGMLLNSPNDVVVRSDGSIWFTDPSYGIGSDYIGHRTESEIGACNVYRVDPADGECRLAADGFDLPNGLAFSLDERELYIADSGASHHMRRFDVGEDGALSGGEVFATCEDGIFDGFRFDVTAGCGRRRPTGSTASTPTARCSVGSWSPRRSPTSPSAGRAATGCSSARRRASTRCTCR